MSWGADSDMEPREKKRFTDQKLTIGDFMDEILVRCPRCGHCAVVAPPPGGDTALSADRRLSCRHCGLVKDKTPESVMLGIDSLPVDSYFELPLWLQTQNGPHTLWAYNQRHLDYIESFVRAAHRDRPSDMEGGLNRTMISRLPLWIKKSANRQRVLSMIAKLKQTLP